MDLVEFITTVIPSCGALCVESGCADDADHPCVDGQPRCLAHCWCDVVEPEPACDHLAA